MFQRRLHNHVGLLILTLCLVAAPLSASTVIYDNHDDWAAATSSYTTVTFDEPLPPAGYESYGTSAGYLSNNVQFTGLVSPTTYTLYRSTPGYLKGGTMRSTYEYKSMIRADLPGEVTSLSVELIGLYGYPTSFLVMLSTGDQYSLPAVSDSTPVFFGLTSDVAITQVSFALASGINMTTQPAIDNFAFGTAGTTSTVDPPGTPGETPGETPEAATLLLVGTGLILFYRYGRNRLPLPA